MNQTIDKLKIEDEVRFHGADKHTGLIQKNARNGRAELQIYSAGDASGRGSRGAGIHLYTNYDSQHGGNIAFLTGDDNKGTARMIIAQSGKISLGTGLWDYVDNQVEDGLLNIVKSGKTVASIDKAGNLKSKQIDKLEARIKELEDSLKTVKVVQGTGELEARLDKIEEYLKGFE